MFRPRLDPHFAVAFGVVALVYAATLLVMPRDGVWIVDEGCRLIQTEGFIRNGYRDVSIPWLGQALDPDLTLDPIPPPMGFVHDGKIVGVFSHAFTAVSALPYALLGSVGLYLLPILAGPLLLPAVRLLADELGAPRRVRPLSVLLVGLCTPVWFYSMTFWEHVPAACLTTWAVVFLWRHLQDGGVRSLAASAIPLWLFEWRVAGSPFGGHLAANTAFYGGMFAGAAEPWQVFRAFLVNGHRSPTVSLLVAGPFPAC